MMTLERNSQNYLRKVIGILTRPNTALISIDVKQEESIFTIILLYITVLLKGILELNYLGEKNRIGWLIVGTTVGLVAAWFSLTFLYHFAARLFGGSGKYENTLLLMGYIAAPMFITAFLSLVIYTISPVIKPEWGGTDWTIIHTVFGWLGMVWGWPGILCYYVLRYGESLSSRVAGTMVGIVLLVTINGWFLPVIIPGLFG